MALDSETKNKIVYYLGYPGKVLIPTSTHYNSIVNDRLLNLNSFIEDQVDDILAEVLVARTNLNNAPNSFKVKQVGDIHFNVDDGKSLASSEYRRLLKELSRLLDIPLRGSGNNVNICLWVF